MTDWCVHVHVRMREEGIHARMDGVMDSVKREKEERGGKIGEATVTGVKKIEIGGE